MMINAKDMKEIADKAQEIKKAAKKEDSYKALKNIEKLARNGMHKFSYTLTSNCDNELIKKELEDAGFDVFDGGAIFKIFW